jgi:coproporphyrinogen III oxidase-like Fe-S oxidoreductase
VRARAFSWRALATRLVRRRLVGPAQHWQFEAPGPGWEPPRVSRTSLYLHVPFCRHACPYCPYTKVPYDPSRIDGFTRAAIAELGWWADATGASEITSIYVGGGTPTLALDSVARVLDEARRRFRLTGPVAIETNPADVEPAMVARLHAMGVALVSLGVQSFQDSHLQTIGRSYPGAAAARALGLLAEGQFESVNADLMFALPGQSADSLRDDLNRAVSLGATQVTAYPLFTFPYTSIGTYLRLRAVRLPNLRARRAHYHTLCEWSAAYGFERVSVWGFRRAPVPRYSSVTRDGYIGIGPGAGSRLPDGFAINTFDVDAWTRAADDGGRGAVALRMPFSPGLSRWWWLYWRLYETRIPQEQIDAELGPDARRVKRWLMAGERAGLVVRRDGAVHLTDTGAFWLHLAQNYFSLEYVNTIWTAARQQPWPPAVAI